MDNLAELKPLLEETPLRFGKRKRFRSYLFIASRMIERAHLCVVLKRDLD